MTRATWWRRYRGWIAIGVLLAIGGAAYTISQTAAPADTGPTYTTQAAEQGTLSVTVAGTGNLALRDEVAVTPEVAGTVEDVKVSSGTTVSVGDVLFTLDDSAVDKEIASALAAKRQAAESVQRAELSVLQAENSLAQLQSRAAEPSSSVSAGEIEAAEKQVTIAESGLTSAKAAASSANLNYEDALAARDDLSVTAPCNGIVWNVDVDEGDAVSGASSSASSGGSGTGAATTAATDSSSASGATSAMTIARDGELAVLLSVNEVDISALKVGQTAELAFDAVPDLTMTGKVDEVAAEGTVSQGVVTYNVWVTLDVSDSRLKIGMSSSATIVTQVARDVLLVPNAAVKSDDEGDYVQVLDSGSTEPRVVRVTSGLKGATQTEIAQGLEAGVAVVTKTVAAEDASDSSSGGTQGGPEGGGMIVPGMGGGPMGGP